MLTICTPSIYTNKKVCRYVSNEAALYIKPRQIVKNCHQGFEKLELGRKSVPCWVCRRKKRVDMVRLGIREVFVWYITLSIDFYY